MNDDIADLKKRIERLERAVFPVEHDDLIEEALKIVKLHKFASAALLQRKLSIGYARAARLLDELENKGIIGPQVGNEPRKFFGK